MDSMVQQIMIHKIFVEYGVTRIGDYSFYLSQANSRIVLYNLDIANTVTSIGKYAFWGRRSRRSSFPRASSKSANKPLATWNTSAGSSATPIRKT